MVLRPVQELQQTVAERVENRKQEMIDQILELLGGCNDGIEKQIEEGKEWYFIQKCETGKKAEEFLKHNQEYVEYLNNRLSPLGYTLEKVVTGDYIIEW